MSVRRAIVEASLDGLNVSAFCREHGISRDRFYVLRRRFEAEGDAGLEPRSRAPGRVANRTAASVEDAIVEVRKRLTDDGFDAGPETIRWHLINRGVTNVPSVSTIWRVLTRGGFVTPDPKKRPRSADRSFVAERANECWQMDVTHWELADGTIVDILDVIDDCSRLCVASRVIGGSTTGPDVWEAVVDAANAWGFPARILTDNGPPFRSALLKTNLEAIGIAAGHSRPFHPQTCGKVERFHQTLKQYLAAQETSQTRRHLQTIIDRFVTIYNEQRPHRSIGRNLPAHIWAVTPKDGPATTPISHPTSIHHNTVDKNGRLEIPGPFSISIGAVHATKTATTIRTGNRAHVFVDNRLIRHLTIDLTRRSQPLYQKPGRPC